MLADPARRTLETRPARRVCCAAKPYRSPVAVRGCAVLATDSLDMAPSCRSPYARTARSRGHILSAQYPLTDCNYCNRFLRGVLLGSPLDILCTCYTITQLPRATGSRMIAPYQSLTLRQAPFRLYGSLRAVKVEFPCCLELPPLTVLAPPTAWLLRLHAGYFTAKYRDDHSRGRI
jgi:hypothetical protein